MLSVAREEHRAVDVGEIAGIGGSSLPAKISLTSAVPAAVPSLFHNSRPCAVGGDEEQRAVDVGQIEREASPASGENVLDQHGAGGRAVALPEFPVPWCRRRRGRTACR